MLSTIAALILTAGIPAQPMEKTRAPLSGVFASASIGGGRGLPGPGLVLSATVAVKNWTLTTRSAVNRRLEPGCSIGEWCTVVDSDEESAYLVGRLFPRGDYLGRVALGTGVTTFTRGTKTGASPFCFLICSEYTHSTSEARGLAWEAAIHLSGGSAMVIGAHGNVNSRSSYAAVSFGFSLGRLSP